MNARRLTSIAIAVLTLIGMAFGLTRNALAVHDLNLFELDRNAQDPGGAPAPDDWATLYGGGGSADGFSGILADIALPGTQFQGGGSKDNNDITQWLWKPGEPLDKDDITNAYAAGYIYQGTEVCPAGKASGDPACTEPGDFIIYFGLDRFANNGSAQVGFWFFQSPVGLTNTPSSGGYLFSGAHSVGDILIQSNFSQGGVISSISVYKWVGSGGSNGALNLIYTAQDCIGGAPNGDLACATVNQTDTPSPWPYTPKAGTANIFPQGSFFEGGVNVSALVPEAGCFSGFMAETRTSDPFDARLKDFALGSLSLCHIEGTKYRDINGNGTRDLGEPGLANWQIKLSGAASLTTSTDANGHYSFDDLGNGSYTVTEVCPSATPAWVQTEPGLNTGDSCGAETYSFNINLSNTVGIGDFGNGAPAIDVAKTCTAVVEVGKPINYTFDVTNTGNVNLGNVDVTDPTAGFSSLNQSLIPGGTQHYTKQVTAPASAQTIINTVSASGDFGSTTVYKTVTDSANCTTKVVDARISITPTATNEVGKSHTFTVLAEKNEGQGAGWVPASNGTIVTVALTDSNGAASSVSTDTCATGTVSGLCSVTFSSSSAGQTSGHASATIVSGGLSLLRQTDGKAGNSGDAIKTWVDARISISPDGTNEVGKSHTFTVLAEKNEGQGAGWVPASNGTIVTVALTDSNGAASSVSTDTCATGTVSGLCSVTFSSSSAGQTSGHASATIVSGGLSLLRQTDGKAGNSGDATKTWVDARISISPDGTNGIGDNHTFDVLVEKNEGLGAGWKSADDGTIVDVTLTDSNGASSIVKSETCSTGTVNGMCSVTFTSNSAGTTKGHASATIDSGGLSLFRETDGKAGNSGDATKIWIAGSLAWLKQDNLGNPLGGATFEVCRTIDAFGNPVSGECVTVLDNSAPDEDSASGQFLLTNLFLGTYTITETVPPGGYAGDSFVETIVLTLADPDQSATHIWVNTPNQGCTPGFWQGGAGSGLWDQVNDPDWIYNGTNPYIHTTLFNSFFNVVTDSRLNGLTMFDLVSGGGGSDPAVKAARDMVAAYLNESAFPNGYPAASLQDLVNMWYNAVTGGDTALSAFHTLVSGWNSPVSGTCPLP